MAQRGTSRAVPKMLGAQRRGSERGGCVWLLMKSSSKDGFGVWLLMESSSKDGLGVGY